MIVPDLGNPFHAQLAVAVERAAAGLGYATLVTHTDCSPDIEDELGRTLFDRRVDGVVIAGLSAGSRMPITLLDLGIPVVLASFGEPQDPRLGAIDHNDRSSMEAIVAHLLSLGHRKMSFVSQSYAEQSGERRRQGFEEALAQFGLSVATSGNSTAYVAHNDVLAIGVIDELERRGVKVPADASVVGHDDIPLAAHSRIRLTTVRSDAHRMGARAVELVTAAARSCSHVAHRELQTNPLIVRESTGAVP